MFGIIYNFCINSLFFGVNYATQIYYHQHRYCIRRISFNCVGVLSVKNRYKYYVWANIVQAQGAI